MQFVLNAQNAIVAGRDPSMALIPLSIPYSRNIPIREKPKDLDGFRDLLVN
jgi:hypothetical protein